jgi:hypothetical protein
MLPLGTPPNANQMAPRRYHNERHAAVNAKPQANKRRTSAKNVSRRLCKRRRDLEPLIYVIRNVHVFICCSSVVLSVAEFLVLSHGSRRFIVTTLVISIGIITCRRRCRLDASKRIIGYPGQLEGTGVRDAARVVDELSEIRKLYLEEGRGVSDNFSVVAFLEGQYNSIGLFGMRFDAAAFWHVLHIQLASSIVLIFFASTYHKILSEGLVFRSAFLDARNGETSWTVI